MLTSSIAASISSFCLSVSSLRASITAPAMTSAWQTLPAHYNELTSFLLEGRSQLALIDLALDKLHIPGFIEFVVGFEVDLTRAGIRLLVAVSIVLTFEALECAVRSYAERSAIPTISVHP